MSLRDPTGRLAQWALTLQGYDFTIQYHSGKDHGNVDALSRRVHTISQQLILPQTPTEELCNVKTVMTNSNLLFDTYTLPKHTATAEKILRQGGQYFLSDNNVLYRQSPTGERAAIHLVVPKTLQTELLHWCHDHFTSGHLGLNKTYERLRSIYFWNNMFADLHRWIESCVSCAQKKRDVHHSKPLLLPIAVSSLWEVIAADCMGSLSATNLGNRYILIISNLFTKYIKTAALPSIETTIITQVFLDKIVFRHGPPHRSLTDRGTNFTSKFMTQLCNDLNINKVFTSSYHPQWDGFVERINGVIMQIIAMYVASDHKDWDTYIPSTTYAHNTSISETIGDSPFFLTYGRKPVKLPDDALLLSLIRSNSVDYHWERLIRQIRTARQLASECTQQAQQRMKLYNDQHAKDHSFRVGHKVWIYNPAVKPGLSKKLCYLWHGPFRLIEQITPVSFKVVNIQGKLQKGSIHVNCMKQYFTYDDPPTDSPPRNSSNEISSSSTPCPKAAVTEPSGTDNAQLADIVPWFSQYHTRCCGGLAGIKSLTWFNEFHSEENTFILFNLYLTSKF